MLYLNSPTRSTECHYVGLAPRSQTLGGLADDSGGISTGNAAKLVWKFDEGLL